MIRYSQASSLNGGDQDTDRLEHHGQEKTGNLGSHERVRVRVEDCRKDDRYAGGGVIEDRCQESALEVWLVASPR